MTTSIKFYKQAIQCTDATTGKVGDFLCESTEAGLVAVSPVFSSLPELFSWLNDSRFALVCQNGLMPWYMDKQELEALYLEWLNWPTLATAEQDGKSKMIGIMKTNRGLIEMAVHYGILKSELVEILGTARRLRESDESSQG
jgi:hypothetical protein